MVLEKNVGIRITRQVLLLGLFLFGLGEQNAEIKRSFSFDSMCDVAEVSLVEKHTQPAQVAYVADIRIILKGTLLVGFGFSGCC